MSAAHLDAAPDRGSTIPLILGLFLLALLLVAGSIALGDAFVQQRQLQDLCDGAAIAAASSADLDGSRHTERVESAYLVLSSVQGRVDEYRDRDDVRASVTMIASLSANSTEVTVRCSDVRTIAFGPVFGFGDGVTHNATSMARGRLRFG